jgi:hypothetical protein
VQEAAAEARAVAIDKGATLVSFDVDEQGRAVVHLARHVEPVAFDAVDALRSWYDVEVDASSVGTLAGPRR